MSNENSLDYIVKQDKLYNRDEIVTGIDRFHKDGNAHARLGHRLCMSIGVELERTRNMELVWQFLDKMPVNVSKSAFVDWFIEFAQVKAAESEAEKAKARHGIVFDKGTDEFNFADGNAKPWWNFKPTKAYAGTNLAAMLEQVVKKAESAQKKGEEDTSRQELDFLPEALVRDVKQLAERADKLFRARKEAA
jgi:hypothetical protein